MDHIRGSKKTLSKTHHISNKSSVYIVLIFIIGIAIFSFQYNKTMKGHIETQNLLNEKNITHIKQQLEKSQTEIIEIQTTLHDIEKELQLTTEKIYILINRDIETSNEGYSTRRTTEENTIEKSLQHHINTMEEKLKQTEEAIRRAERAPQEYAEIQKEFEKEYEAMQERWRREDAISQ